MGRIEVFVKDDTTGELTESRVYMKGLRRQDLRAGEHLPAGRRPRRERRLLPRPRALYRRGADPAN